MYEVYSCHDVNTETEFYFCDRLELVTNSLADAYIKMKEFYPESFVYDTEKDEVILG